MGEFEELRDAAVQAFEDSWGTLPSDVEMGIISMGAREMTESAEENNQQ